LVPDSPSFPAGNPCCTLDDLLTMRSRRLRISVGVAVVVVGSASCSGHVTGAVAGGKRVAADSGCVACHGADGQGGVGPPWQGLAGSVVTLRDGTKVVADSGYLRRSIRDPGAQRVRGYDATMPRLRLSAHEVDQLVAYIRSLR
jgi:cytochrome c oxidase subunit 2